MNEQNYFRVSVKGLVVDDAGRILLAKEANGKWDLLGGGLNHDEEPTAGLRREILEEAGLSVEYISPTPKYFTTSPRPGRDTYIANVIYEIKLKDLNITASEECQKLQYFNAEQAKKLNIRPNVAELLRVYDPALHQTQS